MLLIHRAGVLLFICTGRITADDPSGYPIISNEPHKCPATQAEIVDETKSGSMFREQFDSTCTLCSQSCLPLLPFLPSDMPTTFWCDAFAYSAANIAQTKLILNSENQNLSSSPKELLLWHQRLSHANLVWIQTLMQDQKWLQDTTTAFPFTLDLSFPALLELLRVMFEVLSAQHVFVLRQLLVLQKSSPSLFYR